MLGCLLEEAASSAGQGREVILPTQQGIVVEGLVVSLADIRRRTEYDRSVKTPPKIDPEVVVPINAIIRHSPSFGQLAVAHLFGLSWNTVQLISKIGGWHVRKRLTRCRLRIQALPLVAEMSSERWSKYGFLVWAGRDRWTTLAW